MVNKDELLNIYEAGSGKIKIRGKVEVEEMKGGRTAWSSQRSHIP